MNIDYEEKYFVFNHIIYLYFVLKFVYQRRVEQSGSWHRFVFKSHQYRLSRHEGSNKQISEKWGF